MDNSPPGRFLTTVAEMGLSGVFGMSILFVVLGIVIMMVELFREISSRDGIPSMVMIFCEYVVIMLIRSEIGMKKENDDPFNFLFFASVGALVMFFKQTYKPVSFTVDGDQWSAKLLMEVLCCWNFINDNKSREWSIVSEPETL